MAVEENGTAEIIRAAYEVAWREFTALRGLTPDEKMSGPNRLRWYIHIVTEVGERDPDKIARAALGMMREYEQITRSRARVMIAQPDKASGF